ncbi:MAG: hypothetical protein GY807_11045 [Gammaproteobacteria bacterium]|nr:hypothetical protein [Gammaproteobacteria bacterium]
MKRTVSFLLAVLLLIPPFAPFVAQGEEGTGDASGGFFNEVSDFDGSLNISQKIEVPPGRNGLQPDLVLSYNSNARDIDNLYGHGWSVNIPHIVRLNKTGTNNLYGEDYYHSSLDGELVAMGGGEYKARTDRGNNHTYTLSNDTWIVTDKFGTTHTFGTTSDSRQDNPADSTEIYKWMISETRDSNDNLITYSYFKDGGAIYPDEITYNQDELFAIAFKRSSRSAASTTYPGFYVKAEYEIDKIVTKVDGEKVREYDLARSDRRLTSITETGYTGSSSKSLPARQFDYGHDTGSTTWSYTPSWDSNLNNDFHAGTRFGDVDGDGLPEAVVSWIDSSWGPDHQRHVKLNNGNGWNASGGFAVPTTTDVAFWNNDDGRPGGGHLVDVNGDGLVDFVGTHNGGGGELHFYINDGDGWDYDSSWDKSITWAFKNGYQFHDVNGDGLPDLVLSYIVGVSNYQTQVCLNTGTKISIYCTQFTLPNDEAFAFWNGDSEELGEGGMADINSDGLADLYKFTNDGPSGTLYVYINHGSGWEEDDTWEFAVPEDFAPGTRFYDVNGDGLNDKVQAYFDSSWGPDFQKSIKLNTGAGWSAGGMSIPNEDNLAFWNADGTSPGTGAVSDVNGDGLPDFLSMGDDDEIHVFINGRGSGKGKITEVGNSFGASTTYSFEAAAVNNSSNEAHRSLQVVDTTVRDDGNGVIGTSTYLYKNADHWFESATDRRFAGFGEVTETNDAGHEEIKKFHQANGTSTNELGDSVYAFMGMEYETSIEDSLGDTFRTDRTNYTVTGTTSTSTRIQVGGQLTRHYDGETTPTDVALAYGHDSNGNLTTKTEYGKVTGSADGTFTDTGSDDRETTYTYASSPVGLVTSEVLKNDAGTKVKESKYYYDDQTFGSATDGNLTKREDWISGSTYVDTEWEYNSYGLPTKLIDPRAKETTFSYDSHNLFVATTTNDDGHTIAETHDYSSGQVATTTDANGNVKATAYDPLSRVETEWITANNSSSIVKLASYEYTDTAGAVRIKQTDHLEASLSRNTFRYYDGFGRLIQERAEGEGADYIVRDYVFDDGGLLTRESLPYFDTSASKSNPTTNLKLFTEYAYDPLERAISASTTVGITSTDYDRLKETVTDPLSNDKIYEYDALGRLIDVTEENGISTYVTEYDYDANDNLTKITDADDNERSITYDGLSRRTKLEDLHDTADSTYGSTTFGYDDAGNLTSRVSPNGDVTNWTFDDINRPLTENYTGSAGTEVSYTYDTCTNGKGQICTVVNDAVTSTFTYTANGLPASETKTIDSTAYTTEWEYNRLGRETLITYPDDSEVRYTFNDFGEIERVEQKEDGGSFADLISDFDYGPHGLVTNQIFGNGATTTRTYDADELYRLRSIVTTATTTAGVGGAGEDHALIEAELSGLLADISEPVVEELPEPDLEDTIEPIEVVATSSDIIEEENASTSSITDIPEALATGTEPVVLDVVLIETTAKSNNGGGLKKGKGQVKNKFIKNIDDVKAWRKFHEERVAYLDSREDLPEEVYERAEEAQDKFEDLLLDEGYIKAPGAAIEKDIVAQIWGKVSDWLRGMLPEQAHAYLFGSEDFETCGSLPCSFDSDDSWGSVTPSLDSSGKIEGDDSLKEVVTGQGGGGITEDGFNTDEIWVQFKVWIPSSMAWGASGYATILTLQDSSSNNTIWINLEDWGTPRLIVSGDVLSYTNTSIDLNENAVNTIEMRVKIGSSNGDIDIWHDNGTEGSPDYDGSGSLDTGTDNIDKVMAGLSYSPENGVSTTYYDDAIADSAFIGSAATSSSNATPTAPTLLEAEGQTNPTNITDSTPEFTAIYNDADSGDLAIYYEIEVDDDSGFGSTIWDSGKTALATTTAGNRTGSISYAGSALASSTTYYWRIKLWDDDDAEGAWSTATATFSLAAAPVTNASPTAPTLLETEGQTNPSAVSDNTPEFTAIYNDTNAGDQADNYQLQVATSTVFTSPVWDSGKTAMTAVTAGNRSGEVTYAGTALASSTTYYWRVKFWDDGDAEGLWSTTTSSFVLATGTVPEPPTPSVGGLIQSLHYTYDAVGNISNIVDSSETLTAATTSYTYDDLYRLLTASTSQASSSGYSDSYTYNSIGNITDFDGTSYTYAETGYANPHAVTTVGSATYTYDANGNLTSDGTSTNTWDYNNRLSSTAMGSTTITYGYDHDGQRVSKTVVEETAGGGGSGNISFVAAGTIADATNLKGTTGQVVSVPAGVQDDDFLIMLSHRANDSGDFNTPSGWTRHTAIDGPESAGRDRTTGIFTRVASSEPANYTLTHSDGGGERWASAIVAYRGVDTTNPLDVTPSASHYTADKNDAAPANNSIATVTDDAWVVVLAGITHDDITSGLPPTGYTERVDHTGSTIDHRQIQLADKEISSAGTESPGDWLNSVTSNAAEYNVATMSLRPESSGGGGSNSATTTTLYVSGIYELENGSSTKHVYADNMLIASIDGSRAGALTYFAHLDHLGSTNVMTDGIGETEELLAYYPYGADRIDGAGDIDQTKRFTGHDFDAETDLTYMGARYYAGDSGRFSSQDPVSLSFGDTTEIEDAIGGPSDVFMKNPQMHNSYAYALNNPVRFNDPSGEAVPVIVFAGIFLVASLAELSIDVYERDLVHNQYPEQFTDSDRATADFKVGFDVVTLAAGSQIKGASTALGFDFAMLAIKLLDSFASDEQLSVNEGETTDKPELAGEPEDDDEND